MKTAFNDLRELLIEIDALESIVELLNWDQVVYMPPNGTEARSRQLAILARLAHEKLTDPKLQKLLNNLESYQKDIKYDSYEASLIRVTQYLYEKATHVPADFQGKFYAHVAKAQQAWIKARSENDFEIVHPFLEKTLELSREYANFFPGYEHIADPLVDLYDPGMKVSTIRPIFATVRQYLIPMIHAITEQPVPDNSFLRQSFPEPSQLSFGLDVIGKIGFDFKGGRQDKSAHPFTTRLSISDVRITTRVEKNDFWDAFSSTMHEAGHALYYQGIDHDLEGTPLAQAASAGVSESQARLWENIVGRCRSFWEYFYPRLQSNFPKQLRDVSLESFYHAINRVQPSLIRTEADEVTYNLHVIMRFDFELQLLEGNLAIRDLPEAWRERFKKDFGISLSNDSDGVLQDPHWYDGFIGGQFQCYTLGNIMSAMFFEAATKANPEIFNEIKRGQFDTLSNWLRKSIYRLGRKYTPLELVELVAGTQLTVEPYFRYLKTKYGELYSL